MKLNEVKFYDFEKDSKIHVTSLFMNMMHYFQPPNEEKKRLNIKLIFSKHKVYNAM